jgi:hypothetical protein
VEQASRKQLLRLLDLLRVGLATTDEVILKLKRESSQSSSECQLNTATEKIMRLKIDVERISDQLNQDK